MFDEKGFTVEYTVVGDPSPPVREAALTITEGIAWLNPLYYIIQLHEYSQPSVVALLTSM